MATSSSSPFLKIAGLGALTGVRIMSGPALVIPRLYQAKRRFPFFAARSKPGRTATVLRTMAIAEMIGDKLPVAPDRNAPVPLIGRTLIGALTGALATRTFGRMGGRNVFFGAVTGGAAAAAGAYGIYLLRTWLQKSVQVPGFVAGLAEDAAVLQIGRRILAPA